MSSPVSFAFNAVVSMFLIHAAIDRRTAAVAEPCGIAIADPQPGTHVQDRGTVAGTAAIPPRAHLWILAHKDGINGWWPQGKARRQLRTANGMWMLPMACLATKVSLPFWS
jgi:hypothetical protein